MKRLPHLCLVIALILGGSVARATTVGFAQTGHESVWRIANTNSIKAEAAKRNINLKFVDADSSVGNQVKAVRSFIESKVDAIVLAPLVVTGWEPVLQEAKAAGIPVIIMDRKVVVSDDSLYATFIGSDFRKEGEMAAQWLLANAGTKRRIVELQGEPGSSAANERQRAFATVMARHAGEGFRILDRKVGNFRRDEGRTAMAELLKLHPGQIEIVFAHNDDMALGAIDALAADGVNAGHDVLVISIDATKAAIQAVVDGKLNCTVECNPLFGPKIFDTVERLLHGEAPPKEQYNKDELFDAANAAAALPTRQY